MRSTALHVTFAALILHLASATEVSAHAETPSSETVVALADGWVLRANVGIVQSSNPTELICEEAFLGGEAWMLGALGPTEWLTFGENTVQRTTDGCDFEVVMSLPRRPSDAVAHAESGGAAYLLNGEGGGTDGLWVSTDRGLTFSQLQTFDPANEQTTGVRYVDATTVIVSGYSRTQSGAGLAWRVDVATGDATPLAVPDGVTYPYVIAASPSGHVLLLGRRGDQVLFWGRTDDIGRAELIASTWPSWAALSDDGQSAWVSGMDSGKGIMRGHLDGSGVATWEALVPELRAPCVEPSGEDLYMCGLNRFDDFDLFRITAAGDVEGLLDFRQFVGTRSDCPAGTEVATVCPLVWNELAPYFGIEVPGADMGVLDDVGVDVGPSPGDVGSGRDAGAAGCCATAQGGGSGFLALAVGVAGLLRRRRALTQKKPRC